MDNKKSVSFDALPALKSALQQITLNMNDIFQNMDGPFNCSTPLSSKFAMLLGISIANRSINQKKDLYKIVKANPYLRSAMTGIEVLDHSGASTHIADYIHCNSLTHVYTRENIAWMCMSSMIAQSNPNLAIEDHLQPNGQSYMTCSLHHPHHACLKYVRLE